MARAAPQLAIIATFVSCVFVSVTLVATTTSVVLRSAGSSSAAPGVRLTIVRFITSTLSAKPAVGAARAGDDAGRSASRARHRRR